LQNFGIHLGKTGGENALCEISRTLNTQFGWQRRTVEDDQLVRQLA